MAWDKRRVNHLVAIVAIAWDVTSMFTVFHNFNFMIGARMSFRMNYFEQMAASLDQIHCEVWAVRAMAIHRVNNQLVDAE